LRRQPERPGARFSQPPPPHRSSRQRAASTASAGCRPGRSGPPTPPASHSRRYGRCTHPALHRQPQRHRQGMHPGGREENSEGLRPNCGGFCGEGNRSTPAIDCNSATLAECGEHPSAQIRSHAGRPTWQSIRGLGRPVSELTGKELRPPKCSGIGLGGGRFFSLGTTQSTDRRQSAQLLGLLRITS
jgi:hypothetical protein